MQSAIYIAMVQAIGMYSIHIALFCVPLAIMAAFIDKVIFKAIIVLMIISACFSLSSHIQLSKFPKNKLSETVTTTAKNNNGINVGDTNSVGAIWTGKRWLSKNDTIIK